MKSTIRILIADDHAIVREGALRLLNSQPDMEVVGEAREGTEVMPLARSLHPDVAVLDISMPGLSGLELVPLLRSELPTVQIVLLSVHKKEAFVQQALELGARAYVLKTSPTDDLLAAVRAVHNGEYFLSSKVQAEIIGSYLRQPHRQEDRNALSEREQQVLRMVAQGMTTKQVASVLYLSARTVDKYRASVMQKLNLKSLNELLRYAIQHGLVVVDPPSD